MITPLNNLEEIHKVGLYRIKEKYIAESLIREKQIKSIDCQLSATLLQYKTHHGITFLSV
jgi:hypothetical protein